ncbi:ribose-phosphate pyrophosphokinase [Roseiconus nitratireducens]|uniref:ribose-phosphate diphosphokinase n=1 Tax=Roseiconus nitratireducens TaxID=2605748 RepID=A0A5M6D6L0_9BACT|nr:ribose-phosphate diphosphokinase [Roseiconus nitratireducens]KAA5543131.1 ribose-phosphate pyrophosphokinase [Roseiconus nitratireducens]
MNHNRPMVFAVKSSEDFGRQVAARAGLDVSPHEERDFDGGEHKIRPLCSVRNRDVYVVASLFGDSEHSANDKLCRLLFFIGALRDASAGRVTAIVPYLCYARKDRKTKSRDPVTTRYVARLFEAVHLDHLVTMEVHNLAAFQNAFSGVTTDHLEATRLLVEHFASSGPAGELAVVSPDVGGVKRADLFRSALERRLGTEISSGFLQKQRSEGVVSTGAFVGEVQGKNVILIDDLISSGTTLVNAAKACRQAGAAEVIAAATHGVFSEKAESILSDKALDQVVISDTVPPQFLSPAFVEQKLCIVQTVGLFGDAIHCLNGGGSIVDLLSV